MNKLDLTKKVQTREGRPVEIKLTDARNDAYPIVGYIDDENNFSFWAADGSYAYHSNGERDLINAPEWHLPDPPEGYEWHRTDWTEEMLPEGWRPQYVGESGTEYQLSEDGGVTWQTVCDNRIKTPTPKKEFKYFWRTNAPPPPPKPKLREVQLCAEDVPLMSALKGYKDGNHEWASIVNVTPDGLYYSGPNGHIEFGSWRHLMEEGQINRSVPLTGKWDATAWEKCSKMEEVPA